MTKLFQEMTKEEKIEFFIRCQRLLVKYHPDSPFIFNKKNVVARLSAARDLITSYKGYGYWDDNVCVLYNKIKIKNPDNLPSEIKNNMFREPSAEFNSVIIDFVVFRSREDCGEFCKVTYDPQMEYVVYVKNNKPKIHRPVELMSQLLKLPTYGPLALPQ